MPRNPEDATVDKEAAVAEVKAEETKVETVKFTYRYNEYEAPTSAQMYDDIEFMLAVEDGHEIQMARALLGPQQWRLFALRHRKANEAREMINTWSEAAGLGK